MRQRRRRHIPSTPVLAAFVGIGLTSGVAAATTHTLAGMDASRVYRILVGGTVVETALAPDPAGRLVFDAIQTGVVQVLDAGAGDTSPPAAVTDLAAEPPGETTLFLTWTAPGDDGTTGTATAYEIRWALEPGLLTAAPVLVPNPPAPSSAGSGERVQVASLPSGRVVHLAVRTRDDAGLWSPLSNVVTVTMEGEPDDPPPPPTDTTPPATVSDFELLDVTAGSVLVTWTAPGDDGTSGTASAYELRYATTPITPQNFGSALPALNVPTPSGAGTTELLTVAGLAPDTNYWLALRARDEAGNIASLSNVVQGRTLPGDAAPLVPPGAPQPHYVSDHVTLSWGASTHPGVIGYHVYRRPDGGTETRVTAAPVPATSYEDFTVTDGMAYYYRVTAVDESLNESAHSAETWIRATAGVPAIVSWDRIYPNPVRGRATFRFGIPEVGPGSPNGMRVTIDLYDVAGHRIERVVDAHFLPGVREVTWSVASARAAFAPGLYVSVLRAGSQVAQQKIAIRP